MRHLPSSVFIHISYAVPSQSQPHNFLPETRPTKDALTASTQPTADYVHASQRQQHLQTIAPSLISSVEFGQNQYLIVNLASTEGLLLNIYYLWVYVVNLAVGLKTSFLPIFPVISFERGQYLNKEGGYVTQIPLCWGKGCVSMPTRLPGIGNTQHLPSLLCGYYYLPYLYSTQLPLVAGASPLLNRSRHLTG